MKALFSLQVQRSVLRLRSRAVAAALISAIDPIHPVAAQDETRRREFSIVQTAGASPAQVVTLSKPVPQEQR